MVDQNMIINKIDPERKRIYRIGGIASFMIGILYIGIIILYATVGVPPVGGEAILYYFVEKTTTWWTII